MTRKIKIAIIGCGAVSDFHHVPGLRLDPRAELLAICDTDEALMQKRYEEWQPVKSTTDYKEIADDPDVDAVIIATPNFMHSPIALACIAAGKHVMCEKPLGLNFAETQKMYRAAVEKKVRHMTAFTYRFAPAMKYLKHLVATGQLGVPRHFRSQRFLDWPETSWGWRQYHKLAGAGDLFDMTIHRIDFAQDLIGPLHSVCGAVARFTARDRTPNGESCEPSDVDDWSSLIGLFKNNAVGVWEGSTLMKGYRNGGVGYEWAEVNGSEGSAAYRLTDPNTIMLSKNGECMKPVTVPDEFLVWPGSPRNPDDGEPSTVFRYDLVYEFISAIVEERDAASGFQAGMSAQAIADAVLKSFEMKQWIEIDEFLQQSQ